MFRKLLIIFVMTPLLVAAAVNGAPFPLLLLMFSLLLIAIDQSSARDEQEE